MNFIKSHRYKHSVRSIKNQTKLDVPINVSKIYISDKNIYWRFACSFPIKFEVNMNDYVYNRKATDFCLFLPMKK